MHDEWRLTVAAVDAANDETASDLARLVGALVGRFGSDTVSAYDGSKDREFYVYADSASGARRIDEEALRVARELGVWVETSLERWNEAEAIWEPARPGALDPEEPWSAAAEEEEHEVTGGEVGIVEEEAPPSAIQPLPPPPRPSVSSRVEARYEVVARYTDRDEAERHAAYLRHGGLAVDLDEAALVIPVADASSAAELSTWLWEAAPASQVDTRALSRFRRWFPG